MNKTTSSFPIAIGTALSLESIAEFESILNPYDSNRSIPNKVNLYEYNQFWFNIHTLFRNIVTALDTVPTVKDMVREIAYEIEIITLLLSNEGKNLVEPVFYLPSYKSIYDRMSSEMVRVRKPSTAKQALIHRIYTDTIKKLTRIYQPLELDVELKTTSPCKALILTHLPLDLVSYKNFTQLDLIESHTGVLKPKLRWNSKYYAIPDVNMNNLPFNGKLLKLFGDKHMFSPIPLPHRYSILDIANIHKWTPLTSDAKVKNDLKSLKNQYLYLQYLKC